MTSTAQLKRDFIKPFSSLLQAYYGGEARCDVEMAENFNPEELVCGGCSDIAKAQVRCIQLQT